MSGEAVDIYVLSTKSSSGSSSSSEVDFAENKKLLKLIMQLKLPYDQLINERPTKQGPAGGLWNCGVELDA